MLDGIISFLQKISSLLKNSQNKHLNKYFKGLLVIGSMTLWIIFSTYMVIESDIIISIGHISMVLLFIVISVLYLYILYKQKKISDILTITFTELIPFNIFFGLILVNINAGNIGLYSNLLVSSLIIFPILYRVSKLRDITLLKSIRSFFMKYNLMFFYFLSLHTIFNIFSISGFKFFHSWQSLIDDITRSSSRIDFLEFLMLIPLLFIVILGPIYILRTYSKTGFNSFINFGMTFILGLVILSLGSSSIYINKYVENIIQSADKEIIQKGKNYESFKTKGFLLDQAFLWKIKHKQKINEELFQYIYDASPEEYYGAKIAEYRSNRNNFGTDFSKIGKEAKVILEIGEIESKIEQSGSGEYVTHDFELYFQNTDSSNQEVILFFQTPNKDSVVHDLKLGLNSELIGQIYPRGAAKKVYENSLRRNTDPALIEKIGVSSYSLRIFPIPSINQLETGGRQKVTFSILSPSSSEITYAPKLSFINLQTNKDSRFISKIYKGNQLIQEDIKKGKKIDEYLLSSHTIKNNNLVGNDSSDKEICYHPFTEKLIEKYNLDLGEEKEKNKYHTSIFFDQSLSVSRNNSYKEYSAIYSKIKDLFSDVDIYSYNFQVQKQAEVSDIKYWGYTNTDSVLSYITKNNISGEEIFIVTDDSSFNFEEKNNTSYKNIGGNTIHIIKIGDNIKRFKHDFNMLIGASMGSFIDYDEDSFGVTLSNIIKNEGTIKYVDCDAYTQSLSTGLQYISSLEDSIYNPGISYILRDYIDVYKPEYGIKLNSDRAKEDHIYNEYKHLYGGIFQAEDESMEQDLRAIIKDFLSLLKVEYNTLNNKDIDYKIGISDRVQASWLSNVLLLNKKNLGDFNVAKLQTDVARFFGIINHYNSLIAIETQRQQESLDTLSKYKNAYDVEYDNFSNTNPGIVRGGVIFGNSGIVGGRIQYPGSSITVTGDTGSFRGSNSFSNDVSILGVYKILLYILCIIYFIQITLSYYKKNK